MAIKKKKNKTMYALKAGLTGVYSVKVNKTITF